MIREADRDLKRRWLSIFNGLPRDSKVALKEALYELSRESRAKAEHSWRKGKAPMAAYHRVVGIYAGHLARAIKVRRDNNGG